MLLLRHDAELPKDKEEEILLSIGETESSRKICLQSLTKKLKERKEIKSCLDEHFLLMFLRASKFNSDKAFANIKRFYEMQTIYKDYFELCVLGALTKSALYDIRISPIRLKDNSLLFIDNYFKAESSEMTMKEKLYLGFIMFYSFLKHPINQIFGYTYVLDVAHFSLSQIPHHSDINCIKICVDALQGAVPYTIKEIHVINVSEAFFQAYYKIFYPWLPEEIKKQIKLYATSSDYKKLHESIEPEALPEKYGGHLKECDLMNGMEKILMKEDYVRKHSPLI